MTTSAWQINDMDLIKNAMVVHKIMIKPFLFGMYKRNATFWFLNISLTAGLRLFS